MCGGACTGFGEAGGKAKPMQAEIASYYLQTSASGNTRRRVASDASSL